MLAQLQLPPDMRALIALLAKFSQWGLETRTTAGVLLLGNFQNNSLQMRHRL